MGMHLRCGRNKVYPLSFHCWNGLLLCSHGGIQGKHYTLIDLPVHGEQTDCLSCFSCALLSD